MRWRQYQLQYYSGELLGVDLGEETEEAEKLQEQDQQQQQQQQQQHQSQLLDVYDDNAHLKKESFDTQEVIIQSSSDRPSIDVKISKFVIYV